MKKIFIIDDNVDKVNEIFGNICKLLWKGRDDEGIAAEVIFLGDKYKARRDDCESVHENMNSLIKSVNGMLRSHCRNTEQWETDGEMFKKKKKLIDKLAKSINYKEKPEIESLVNIWKDNQKLCDLNKIEEIDFSSLTDYIFDGDSIKTIDRENCYILVDVILFFDDEEYISDEIPIFSMGLYHFLRNQGFKCFLYSSYAYNYLLIDKYKEIYRKVYNQEVEVYHSKYFFSQKVDSENCLFFHINK